MTWPGPPSRWIMAAGMLVFLVSAAPLPFDIKDISIVSLDTAAGAQAYKLPSTPGFQQGVLVKDTGGNASINPITISAAQLDGGTTVTISQNYGAVLFVFNGRAWVSISGPGTGTISVPNNSVLRALPTVLGIVQRNGFSVAGDAPPLMFSSQTGTCAGNGMVNDGGSCVDATSGGSWRAIFPAEGMDVRQFGASVYNDKLTATCGAGSAAVGLTSPGHFRNGQAVLLIGCGPASTIGLPTGLAVAAQGTTAAQAWHYKVAARKANSQESSAATAKVSIANGNLSAAAISVTAGGLNFNRVQWANNAGATGACVYRSTDNITYALLACVDGTAYNDYGPINALYTPSLHSATPPAVARSRDLLTTIVSGAGTASIVVANAASSATSTGIAIPENTSVIQNAINQCASGPAAQGRKVSVPDGFYTVSALAVSGSCEMNFAAGSALYTYDDTTTLTLSGGGTVTLGGELTILPYDLSTKTAGRCIDQTGQAGNLYNKITCRGYAAYLGTSVGAPVFRQLIVDQMMGSQAVKFVGSSGGGNVDAPEIQLIGGTTFNVRNPDLDYLTMDSYTHGMTVRSANLAGGGRCFVMDNTVDVTTASQPRWAWLEKFGCDTPARDAVSLIRGFALYTDESYIASSLTGAGIRIGANHGGKVVVESKTRIASNCQEGINVAGGTDSVFRAQVFENSGCGGFDEVLIGANVNRQTVRLAKVSNTDEIGNVTTDRYCTAIAAGTGDFITIDNEDAAGCTTGKFLVSASGTHNSLTSRYDGGTWTPTLVSASGAASGYTQQTGTYKLENSWVTFNGRVIANTLPGTAGATQITIGALPYTNAIAGNKIATVDITGNSLNLTAGNVLKAIIQPNTSAIGLFQQSTTALNAIAAAQLGANADLIVSGSYKILP